MVATLRRAIVKSPRAAFLDESSVAGQWEGLGYTAPPNIVLATAEHDRLVQVMTTAGVEIIQLPQDDRVGMDSIYVHDPCIVTDGGAIVFDLGKEQRRSEGQVIGETLLAAGVPILGHIGDPGTAEGGDTLWLDHDTLVVGHSYRTNGEGIQAMAELIDLDLLAFDLPHHRGPSEVLHLQSLISMVAEDWAVVHAPLMPVPLMQLLKDRGFELTPVPSTEWATMGCNILALAPRHVVILEDNSETARILEEGGCRVERIPGAEMAHKGAGGPTCLTRPILRG